MNKPGGKKGGLPENMDHLVLNDLNRFIFLFDPQTLDIEYRGGALNCDVVPGDGSLSSLLSRKSLAQLKSISRSIRGIYFMYGLEFRLLSGQLVSSYGSFKRVLSFKRPLILGVFYFGSDTGAVSRFQPGFSMNIEKQGYWVGNLDRTFYMNDALRTTIGSFDESTHLFDRCMAEDKAILKASFERLLEEESSRAEYAEVNFKLGKGGRSTFQLRLVGGMFGNEKVVRVLFLETDSWIFQLEMDMYHRRLEMAAGHYSGAFIRESTLETAIEKILGDAGQLLDASRGYILQFLPDLDRVFLSHEWSAPGVERVQSLSTYDAAEIGHFIALMHSRKSLVVYDKREMEAEFNWKALPHIAKAFLIFPLLHGEKILGVVGFGEVRFERFWTCGELLFVSKVAEALTLLMERAHILDSLKREKLRAEEAARVKEKFLATISHEVRNPLNAIIGLSQMLLEEGVGEEDPAHMQALDFIQSSGRNLSGIMENILDLSKLSLHEREPDFQPTNTQALMYGMESYLKGRLYGKDSVSGRVRWNGLPQSIVTDREFVQGILMNLLDNAVKFTERGEVELVAETNGRNIVFYVRDTGVGIEQHYLEKIFMDFYQIEQVDTRKHGGIGAGLAIVRKMADAIDATVQVESDPGKGSCFSVSIPIRRVKK